MGIKKDAVTSGDVVPAGVIDFEKLIKSGMVYVDKTSCLEELLNSGSQVPMILRPGKFGKTLFMSMLSCFLEMNYQNPRDRRRQRKLFRDLAISENKAFCAKHMGRYPVISLSLKDADGETFQDAVKAIIRVFAGLSDKFDFLTRRDDLDTVFLQRIRDLNAGKVRVFGNDGNFESSIWCLLLSYLGDLAKCLHQAFNNPPVIIIDDWDHPLQKATVHGYYTDMIDIIQGILSAALKDSSDIFRGFITGVHHISYQSIYSGFNNYDLCSINDPFCCDFIGFTKTETADLLKCFSMENRIPDVIERYGGYSFAGADLVCPEGVIRFLAQAFRPGNNSAAFLPENFRINSNESDIIEICMKSLRSNSLERIQHLLEGQTEEIVLRKFTFYPAITANTDFDTFATMMLHTGYLTVARDAVPSARNRAVVKIPNNEVLECFSEKAETIFSEGNPEWLEKAMTLRDTLLSGDTEQAQDIMNAMLRRFISVRDTSHEYYYHMFLSGVLSITSAEDIDVISQIEEGDGYPDIIIDNTRNREAVILELKKADGKKYSQLEKWAEEALDQIKTHDYDRDFRDRKYRKIFSFGISFFGKECLALKMPDDSARK